MSFFLSFFKNFVVFRGSYCYTYSMNKLTQSRPFDVSLFDTRLKVFRVGNTFGIKKRAELESDRTHFTVHSHFTYEVFFVTDGRLELIIGDQTRTYERKVLIIPPKVKHFSVPSDTGSYSLLFSFDLPDSKWQAVLDQQLQQDICCLPLTEDMSFYVKHMAHKGEFSDPIAEHEKGLFAALLFYEIFSQLLPQNTPSVQPEEKGSAKHIYAIEAYINRSLRHRITLTEVAAHMALSTRQVSRIIQKEYGCTLSQLVTDKKLSAAELLVRTGDMPIEEIAVKSELGSPNYFYTLFKKRYGMSPLQYRKQHQL